jgi:hypothetical protein
MARGKYSVLAHKKWSDGYEFKFNAYGKKPEPWTYGQLDSRQEYNPLTMFPMYDEEGYDRYGYSAFDREGNYVGDGEGVDRAGWTEEDYLLNRDGGGEAHYG